MTNTGAKVGLCGVEHLTIAQALGAVRAGRWPWICFLTIPWKRQQFDSLSHFLFAFTICICPSYFCLLPIYIYFLFVLYNAVPI